jgi:hypothetical protein
MISADGKHFYVNTTVSVILHRVDFELLGQNTTALRFDFFFLQAGNLGQSARVVHGERDAIGDSQNSASSESSDKRTV